MVYRKGNYRKKKYKSKSSQLYRDVKHLKQIINVEEKKVNNSTISAPGWLGEIIQLNTIAQGVTDTTRDGDSLKLQDLYFRLAVTNVRTAVARVIIFWDQQNKVALAPAAVSLLDNIGTGDAPLSYKDYDKRFETKILYDRVINIDPNNQQKIYQGKLRISKHTQFENGSTTINTGSLKVLFLGDASTGQTQFRWVSRLTFTDN